MRRENKKQFERNRPSQSCQCRREFVQAGALGLMGLSLADLIRGRAVAGANAAIKARGAIFIWLEGGPSHHDTFDPKPDAAAEIRGEFSTIETSVPAIRFSESVPLLAAQMNRLAVIRSLTHRQAAHEPGQAYMISGYKFRPGHNFPSAGSVVSHERENHSKAIGLPSYIAIPNEQVRGGGHLGSSFNPLSIPGDPNAADFRVQDMFIPEDITKQRFQRRRELSRLVNDEFRKSRESDVQRSVDKYTQQAYDLITSPKAQAAFDLKREDDKTRNRYGRSTFGQRLLMARRLIEAGVPFVTASGFGWDDHRRIFPALKEKLPVVDCAVSALIADLDERGLLDETLIVMTGEFGRTPKINENQGRDHWSQAFSVLLSGGGVRGGQVIGASDEKGAFPKERPVSPEELFHSIYTLLGINPRKFLMSTNGREIQIVRDGKFIPEMTG